MAVKELGTWSSTCVTCGARPPSTATSWDGPGYSPSRAEPVGVAAFSGGRTHHELLLIEVGADAQPIPAGRRVGMYHFGLKVGDSDDELRQVLAQLTVAGVTMVGSSDHGVTHSLYVLDPDGNEVELYIDVPGVDWHSDPTLVAAAHRPLRL